jgi:hypothetical protein
MFQSARFDTASLLVLSLSMGIISDRMIDDGWNMMEHSKNIKKPPVLDMKHHEA